MDKIILMRSLLQSGDAAKLAAMLEEGRSFSSFRHLGQMLFWERCHVELERLIEIGLTVKEGELLVLDLGFQLIPPGSPNSYWATPPFSEQLALAYAMIEGALTPFPEPLSIFQRIASAQRVESKRIADAGRQPGGYG